MKINQWLKFRPALTALMVGCLGALALGQQAGEDGDYKDLAPKLNAGMQVPDFTVYAPDGKAVKLSDFKGKTVVIDFWATWCHGCVEGMPKVQKLAESLKDQNAVVLGICVGDTRERFDPWLKEEKNVAYKNIQFLFNPSKGVNDTFKDWGIMALPTKYVIGPDGKVVVAVVGGGEKKIAEALQKCGLTIK